MISLWFVHVLSDTPWLRNFKDEGEAKRYSDHLAYCGSVFATKEEAEEFIKVRPPVDKSEWRM
jgi:hypothetical protein